jgi:Protein of unknown function (DUF4238)
VFDSGPFNPHKWTLVSRTKNPWGEIPMTGGGRSRTDRAKKYMADVIAQSRRRDAVSKRHHDVPKGYLKAWSPDGKRVEVVDTATGAHKFQGLGDTCVKEHFYQLFDADGAHNQAEKMMSVLDDELVRVVRILLALRPGDDLSFEDFMSFGHMITLQRTRTPQTRRLMSAWGDWIAQQTWRPGTRPFTATSPVLHLSSLFDAMWEGADNMTTRTLELWDDPKGRFITCDAPVQVPHLTTGTRQDLMAAQRIWWPISPTRAVCSSHRTTEEKVTFMQATTLEVDEVRAAMIHGRERVLIATKDQLSSLPVGKRLRKRTQIHLRCEPVPPPQQCRVARFECYAAEPDIALCRNHRPLVNPRLYA